MAITLRAIEEDDLEKIMDWRMSDSVTRYMNTNPELTLEGQKKWLDSLKYNNRYRYWLIEVGDVPAGVINLAEIDWKNKTTSWGYYIGEKKLRSLWLAISLEMSLYDFCFDVLGFEEVHNEVFKLNEGVWKIHLACGCRITEEGKQEVEKEGMFYDIVHLSIEKDEWMSLREKKKYEKIDFDIFKDSINKMIPHHLGIAVSDIKKSIQKYRELGWILEGDVIEDVERNVDLAFLIRTESTEVLELVSPRNGNSPVSNTLGMMKNMATPYHICYEVDDLEKTIDVLKNRKYILTDKPKPAIAFDNRRVAFLVNRDMGLIELLEE